MGTSDAEAVVGSCVFNTAIELKVYSTEITVYYSTSDPNGGRAAVEEMW